MSSRQEAALVPSAAPVVSLPYRFDTAGTRRLALKFAGALEAVMLLGVFKNVLPPPDFVATGGCLVLMLFIAGFGWLIYRNLGGSVGVLRADGVEIEPPILMRVRANGSEGFFPLGRFTGIRVDRVPIAGMTGAGTFVPPFERVFLAGRGDTPDVLIARTQRGEGPPFGRRIGELLGLPVEERVLPY